MREGEGLSREKERDKEGFKGAIGYVPILR